MINKIKITSLAGRGSVTMETRNHQGYWLGAVDWGEVEGQHNTYSYPNQIGESIVSTSIGTRSLSITGWVIDADESTMQSRCNFLNAFFSPVEDYVLEYKNRKIQFRPDASIRYAPEYESNNEKVRSFLLQATCPYPLFTDLTDTAVPFDLTENRFVFPTSWGQSEPLIFASANRAYSAQVNNVGGFSAGLTAVLKFSGDVHNPRIKNLTSGNFIGVNGTFHDEERLEICTVPGKKSIKTFLADGTEVNIIKYRDYRMSWIQLVPGTNVLALDCDDLDERANMTVTVYFTPLYLEVE